MNEQWKQLKDTIIEIRDNNEFEHGDVTLMCRFLANYMEVLEKQMQEPCEDAISRQAVKELYYKDGYISFRKICELPPVTPQPKMGKWIKSQDSYGNNHFTCPFCEHDIATKADTLGDNYCSNCGAKLQEVEE